jgi:hypothetical protein
MNHALLMKDTEEDSVTESWLCVDCGANTSPGMPPEWFPVISHGGENISEFDNLDQIFNFADTQDFRVDDPVVITASIGLFAGASGGGSHAEVNFQDGEANFIQPQGLWVSPVP